MVAVFRGSTRRLPGFRFETQAPQLAEVLPRMDVAAFVGFAASGPIETPVAVESAAQFAAIFGEDAPLALDHRTGSNVTAFLAPAVRAFFRNGGRRCWIVRVARREPSKLNSLNRAQYNYFRVPGLGQVTFDQQGKIVAGIESATLRARSEGSWSDALRVASSLVSRPSEKVVGTVRASGGELWIELENSKPNPIVVGDLIKLEYNGNVVLFVGVSSIGRPPVLSPPASPINPNSQRTIHIKSKQFISLSNGALDRPQARIPPATQLQSASVLSFELWVQKENDYLISLSDLGFEENHPRFWGNLPTDEVLYGNGSVDSSEPPSIVLWKPVGDIFRFPLAGTAEKNAFYFPTTMSAIPAEYKGRVELSGTSLERDGLAEFDAELFLDEELTDASTEDLLSRAEYIRDQSPAPRALKGIHAVLGLDEATIVAVPDAVHLGWTQEEPDEALPPINEPPPHRDEWWHFVDCNLSPKTDPPWALRQCDQKETPPSETKRRPPEPLWENFLNSDIEIITAPVLEFTRGPGGSGTINFKWTSATADADFVLQESSSPNFADAEAVYTGRNTSFTLFGRRVGTFYYRVKAQDGRNFSDWSPGIVIAIRNETGRQSKGELKFSSDTLLAVHRSLLRMSAARGDLFAVLSLPEHFREDQSIEFVTAVKSLTARGKPAPGVAVLIDEESKTLSYGAVYHPWPIAREETRSSGIRSAPPCGSICGLMANRSIGRGAWVAPANEALRGVVALNPTILRERRLDLQEANINLIRHEPRGFLVLDADTLSTGFDLRQINVRRLLSLLRRVALKLGATYVFEPHNEAFRRLVRRGFELLLDQLFERGAFAGTTPETAYQVVVDESLNNLNSVEQGRFIVELRVAPSLPLRFLTVRLVQNTDRGFVTERGNS